MEQQRIRCRSRFVTLGHIGPAGRLLRGDDGSMVVDRGGGGGGCIDEESSKTLLLMPSDVVRPLSVRYCSSGHDPPPPVTFVISDLIL